MVAGQLRNLLQILIWSRFGMKPTVTYKALNRYAVSSVGVTAASKYDDTSHSSLVCCWKELECLRPARSGWVFSTGLRTFFYIIHINLLIFAWDTEEILERYSFVIWSYHMTSFSMANWPFVIRNVHLYFYYAFSFFNFQPLVVFGAWQFGFLWSWLWIIRKITKDFWNKNRAT